MKLYVFNSFWITISPEQVDRSDSHKVTCAIRQRYTKQRITGCPRKGHVQGGCECERAFDNKLDGCGWAYGGQIPGAEATFTIELATVAYIELLFHYDNDHIWEEFEIHILHDGVWDRDMDLTINIFPALTTEVVKRCGSRFRIIRDGAGNPKRHSEWTIGFANGPVHRVEGIFFKVHDAFTGNVNAVLSEFYVYGTKTGQFASTTKDHMGRYLMASQDNQLLAVDSVSSAPASQFEMEPLAGGLFAWRNINKLYMECSITDGSLKFTKQTFDEPGVKITIEELPDMPDMDMDMDMDMYKQTFDELDKLDSETSSLPMRTTPQTNQWKSCHAGLQHGTCNATKTVGAAIKDHNQGGKSTGKTWEECLELYCKDIQCKSFDYVSTSGNCYISHNKWDEVGQQYRKEEEGPTVSYNEIEITPLPLKTPKKSKRVAFRTEMGGYISVDQQGQLTCGSFTLDENAIFDLVRPIETGSFNKFENC